MLMPQMASSYLNFHGHDMKHVDGSSKSNSKQSLFFCLKDGRYCEFVDPTDSTARWPTVRLNRPEIMRYPIARGLILHGYGYIPMDFLSPLSMLKLCTCTIESGDSP